MAANIQNRLSELRQARGIAAADLASRVGVKRQTIYAIEGGTFVPNTEVTLRLARELEVTVEELFRLPDEPDLDIVHGEVLGAVGREIAQTVQVARVGGKLIGVPVTASPYFLAEGDGLVSMTRQKGSDMALIKPNDRYEKRLILAGCDPAIGLLAGMVERQTRVVVIPAPAASRQALNWLREGKVHIAGTHLKDEKTGEFNLPILAREYPKQDFLVVTFAAWQEGFLVAPGNPKSIRRAEDLAKPGVRLVNRERGSGSRALLDRLLAEAGVEPHHVMGYDRTACGHLAVAYAISNGDADCGIATLAAARPFGLDFMALQSERYDFVVRRSSMDLPEMRMFFDVLQRADLRQKLSLLASYETANTGAVIK